jgi:cobalt/nickel transport system permease protein
MAHLVDGVVSAPVLVGGTVVAAAAIAYGLRRIDGDRLPYAGLMSATFFVASLVHVPLGPSNVHLMLTGLLGIVLGWAAVPAIFVGLLLQAAFFGFGGVTVLGVNTLIMGLPAVACHLAFSGALRAGHSPVALGAAAGALAVAGTAVVLGGALAASGAALLPAAKLVLLAHLPVIGVEAVITGAVVGFLCRVKPEVLSLPMRLADQRPGHAG